MNRRVVALILSGIFPGLGQLYNRQWLTRKADPVLADLWDNRRDSAYDRP